MLYTDLEVAPNILLHVRKLRGGIPSCGSGGKEPRSAANALPTDDGEHGGGKDGKMVVEMVVEMEDSTSV
jgi:hypothetical protein